VAIRDIIGAMSVGRKVKGRKPITAREWDDAADEIDNALINTDIPSGGGVPTDDPRLSDAREPLPHQHTPEDMKDMGVITIAYDDPRLSDAREPTAHEHEPDDIIGGVLVGTDPRLADARTPTAHNHAATDVTGTAVITNDPRLSDARTPNSHAHVAGDVTGTAVLTNDSRLSDARTPTTHNHDSAYEAKNSNIQAHVVSAHAPSGAQANSDITKAEIEAKLTGALSSHTHAYEAENANIQAHVTSSHAPAGAQANADITKAEIEAKLTGAVTSHTHSSEFLAKLRLAGNLTNATVTPAILTDMVFSYEANSFYVFEMFMLCTSAATTTGYAFALDVSTAVTSIGLSFTHQLATGGTLSGGDSIADNVSRGLSSGVPAITVSNPVMGHGILITGANTGTAQFMFRPEVAASATCKAGSVIRVMKIA